MIKNDIKSNLLFMVLALFTVACSVNNPGIQKKSVDSSNSSHLRSKIEDFAKKQIGVKYKYGGKNPSGFDCSGFTSYVFDKIKVSIPPTSSLQAKKGKNVNLKWVKKGDLVFFGRGGKISHVALVLNNKKDGIYVIHSTSSRGVVVENISKSSYWKKRIMFARNILGT